MEPAVLAHVALGANLGDARATVDAAFAALDTLPFTRLLKRSRLYRSAPVDAPGPDFINAVALLETRLAPEALLKALQGIEAAHGRTRQGPNAARTLDLDLLLHGDTLLARPELTLPHPRLHERAFVLRPLLDVGPGDVHIPGRGVASRWLDLAAGQHIEALPP